MKEKKVNEEEPKLLSVRYDGPSGTFIAGEYTFTIWNTTTQVPPQLLDSLRRNFPEHTFVVVDG